MSASIPFPPIIPIAELDSWAKTLGEIAESPLAFCEDFPTIAQRFKAWWAQDVLDRPIFIATANRDPSRPITRRLELLDRPEEWLVKKLTDLHQTHRVGDALPYVRADFGPVLLANFFGGRREFGSDTAWTHPFIDDDWSNAPDWYLDEQNCWWVPLRNLTDSIARDAPGRYLACTPDLGGSADVLLNLRGSTQLCVDVIAQPERVHDAITAIYPAWRRVFAELYRLVLGQGAGLIHWLALWSNKPYTVPACDFNFMIGPAEFQRICLPDIARQSATIGRAVFHLDGPGAARHINALLEVPDIQAIQFTPGEGTPSALAWVDMFRTIQARGRSVLVFCPAGEVLDLCEALRPEGLAIMISTPLSPSQLDELFAEFCRASGLRQSGK
jgi:hypothetical protein